MDSFTHQAFIVQDVAALCFGFLQQACSTRALRAGWLNSSEGCKSDPRYPQSPVPLECSESGGPSLASFWWLLAVFGDPWLIHASLHSLPLLSPGVLLMSLGLFTSLLRMPVIGLGPTPLHSTPLQYDLILTNYIGEDPIS
jgi:hypothetical protein